MKALFLIISLSISLHAEPTEVVYHPEFDSVSDVTIVKLKSPPGKASKWEIKKSGKLITQNPPFESKKMFADSLIYCKWGKPKESMIFQIDSDLMVKLYHTPESELRITIKIPLEQFLKHLGVDNMPKK